MRVVVTGARGFLGWHTRVRLRALTDHTVVPVSRATWKDLRALVATADAVVHIAGVNRATPDEQEGGNIELAHEVAEAVKRAGRGLRIVYANSIQAGNDSPYGIGKSAAGRILRQAAEATGSTFVDVRLPNLFGEHARPRYNSFVATFVDAVIKQEGLTIRDRLVPLLHVQDGAASLINGLSAAPGEWSPTGIDQSVQAVHDKLRAFDDLYKKGDVPGLESKFDVDLFNTFRAALFPDYYPIALPQHVDDRGRLVETVRAHGGQGQTFVSTTKPGMTRGEHFHLTKVERFVVISGQARISLRKVLDHKVVSFNVSGDHTAVVDMPTMWIHNITNTGSSELTTLFWTHGLFDAEASDTYSEKVICEGAA